MARFAKAGWRSGTHLALGVRSLPLGWVEPESRPQVPESANPECVKIRPGVGVGTWRGCMRKTRGTPSTRTTTGW